MEGFRIFQNNEKWRRKKWRFFLVGKSIYPIFSETLNLADFKYVLRFLISSFDQKLQSSEVGPFRFFPFFDLYSGGL